MLLRFCSLLPIPFLLLACAAPPAGKGLLPTPGGDTPLAPGAELVPVEALPKIELTDELLLRFLVGDIAAQRGQSDLAAKAWLDVAKTTKDPRVAKRATELSLSAGQVGLALESSKIWSQASPDSVPALQLQISLLMRANRLAEVEALIPALMKSPARELANFYMQLHLFWVPSADKAEITRLTGLMAQGQPGMAEAHFSVAVMHAMQERDVEAIAALDSALSLQSWWEQAVLYKAQLLGQKSPDKAITFLREAVNKNPENIPFAMTLASSLMNAASSDTLVRVPADANKKLDEARKIYDSILNRQPDHQEALTNAGVLAIQQRDLDGAYRYLSTALMRGPRSADMLRYMLGQIEEERNRSEQALDWYRQTGGSEKSRAQARMAHILAKQGKADAALAAIGEIQAETRGEKIDKYQLEGQVWRLLNENKKGLDVLNRAVDLYPDVTVLYYDRSLFLDALNDVAAAEADLRRVLDKQPDNVMAINALGYILANRSDRLAEAETLLGKAIALDPDNPTIIDSVGWLRFKQGRLSEAEVLLARAYGLLEDAEIAAHYIEVLWQSGDKNKARAVLDKALARAPQDELLLATRKRLGL